MHMLNPDFFNRDACQVARELLGKIIRHKVRNHWLSARIIETEAYYLDDKGSHASLGYTEKRSALFMPAGTIYMYYARGGDSLNVSCRGQGNAVLIKSAWAGAEDQTDDQALAIMQKLNPLPSGELRKTDKLCSGQTLLCRSLGLKVKTWDQKQFDKKVFYIDDTGHIPTHIIQTTRLGIPAGRDAHLDYRFIDYELARYCTRNPLTRRGWHEDIEYRLINSRKGN